MATITSSQSGNWEDTTTWIGGVVPTSTDDVVIADGHKVFLTSNHTHQASITLGNTNNTTALTVGNIITKERAELTLDGATVSGIGRFGVQYGYLRGGDAWSFVSTRFVLNEIVNAVNWCGWDIEKITFKDCELVRFGTSTSVTGISELPEWTLRNSVFKNCTQVQISVGGQTLPSHLEDLSLSKVSFISCPKIIFGSQFIKSVSLDFCYGFGTLIEHAADTTIKYNYTNSGFVNTNFLYWSYANVSDCYFGTKGENEARAVGLPALNGVFTRVVAYGSPNGSNSRVINQDKIYNSFIEDRGSNGGNPVLGGMLRNNGVDWENNILIGTGDGFTSLFGEVDNAIIDFNCSNNTVVSSQYFANNERYTPSSSSSIVYRNNLHIPSDTGADFIFSQNGMVGPTHIDSNYNLSSTNGDWTGGTSNDPYVNSSGQNNEKIADDYPSFIDATRNHETYADTFLGGGGYEAVFAHLKNITGYDDATETNANTPVTNIPQDMLTWFQDGYTPQNMALATAGEGGTFVGAIMPKNTPTEEVVVSISGASSITLGQTITYTFTLDKAYSKDISLVVSVDGTNRNVSILANSLSATTSYTPTIADSVLTSIVSTGDENVSIGTGSVTTQVTEIPSSGGFYWCGIGQPAKKIETTVVVR